MSKDRIPIPTETASKILFLSDRTCCVCAKKVKIQIHHIDDDPSNNELDNLAVLCLDCHAETQVKGGFHRKLDASQIRLYRESWLKQVAIKRGQNTELVKIETLQSMFQEYTQEIKNELNAKFENPIQVTGQKELPEDDRTFDLEAEGKKISELVDKNEFEKALDIVNKVLIKYPTFESGIIVKAVIQYQNNELDSALKSLEEYLKIDPKSSIALTLNASIMKEKNQTDKGLDLIKKALSIEPDDEHALYIQSQLYLQKNETENAKTTLKKLVNIKPDDIIGLNELGILYGKEKKYEESYSCFDSILRIVENNEFGLFNKGLVLNNMGKYSESLDCFDKLLQKNPDNLDALNLKGESLTKLKKYDEALREFEKALKIDPKSVDAFLEKGRTYYELGEIEKEIECLNKALEIDPENESALFSIGIAYLNTNADKAIEAFDKLLLKKPKDTELLVRKGHALTKKGKYKKANQTFEEILKIKKNDGHAFLHLGEVKHKQGDYDGAIKYYDQISKNSNVYPSVLFMKARALCLKHDPEYAMNLLSMAVAMDNDYKKMAIDEDDFVILRDDPIFLRLFS